MTILNWHKWKRVLY